MTLKEEILYAMRGALKLRDFERTVQHPRALKTERDSARKTMVVISDSMANLGVHPQPEWNPMPPKPGRITDAGIIAFAGPRALLVMVVCSVGLVCWESRICMGLLIGVVGTLFVQQIVKQYDANHVKQDVNAEK